MNTRSHGRSGVRTLAPTVEKLERDTEESDNPRCIMRRRLHRHIFNPAETTTTAILRELPVLMMKSVIPVSESTSTPSIPSTVVPKKQCPYASNNPLLSRTSQHSCGWECPILSSLFEKRVHVRKPTYCEHGGLSTKNPKPIQNGTK